MAITLPTRAIGYILGQKLFHRPLHLAALASLGVALWLGLSAWHVLIDRPLAPEKISAHRLRVNTAQLNNLQTMIAAYQSPAAPGTIRADLIAPAPK